MPFSFANYSPNHTQIYRSKRRGGGVFVWRVEIVNPPPHLKIHHEITKKGLPGQALANKFIPLNPLPPNNFWTCACLLVPKTPMHLLYRAHVLCLLIFTSDSYYRTCNDKYLIFINIFSKFTTYHAYRGEIFISVSWLR